MTTATAQDEIVRILASLKMNGVTNVALTTMEGRSLGSTVTEVGARFKLGALSAASVAIGNKTAAELNLGDLTQVEIMAGEGSLILSTVGRRALLSVVIERGADSMGIAREMKRAAVQLLMIV